MRTLEDLIGEAPSLAGLAPEHRSLIAGCGRNVVFDAGAYLLREGDTENVFYILRRGTVALEIYVPQAGPMTVQTLHEGDLLGWSWLLPPYRAAFDARALEPTHAVAFDAECLRGKSEEDPVLGYALLKLFAAVVVERLQNTRLQLLDVYGKRERG